MIHFFDINGEYKENVEIDEKSLLTKVDSPLRLLNEYTTKNNLKHSQNKSEDGTIIEYKLETSFGKEKSKQINCYLINNFSVSHQSTLNSLGYIVFCNLENELIFDMLEKIN